VPIEKLNSLSKNQNHQGVAYKVSEAEFYQIIVRLLYQNSVISNIMIIIFLKMTLKLVNLILT
jgi:hypothetical protein